jgi:predicted membrane channel-forming protein YqfA (hemolysin III family)
MTDYRVSQGEVQEDQITAAIEKVTAQVPSSIYLAAALASMAVSVSYKIAKKNDMALFIGQWAAPFLTLGIYNKLVKLHGSDGTTHA